MSRNTFTRVHGTPRAPATNKHGPDATLSNSKHTPHINSPDVTERYTVLPRSAPRTMLCTPSHLGRLASPVNGISPSSTAIPSLYPGSSASSATSSSPVSPTEGLPFTPFSLSNRLEHARDGTFSPPERKQHREPEPYIRTWLRTSQTTSPESHQSIPVGFESPVLFNDSYTVPSQRSLPHHERKQERIVQQTLRQVAPPSRERYSSARPIEENRLDRPAVFKRAATSPHPNQARKGVSNAVKCAVQSLLENADAQGYDPYIDGNSMDSVILRENILDPWPYNNQPVQPRSHYPPLSHYPSGSSTPEDTHAASASLKSDKKVSKLSAVAPSLRSKASKLAVRASSYLGTQSKPGASLSRINTQFPEPRRTPNSQVPHPEWGTFAFRSDDDTLEEDEDDGDLQVWLSRVTRKGIMNAAETFRFLAADTNAPFRPKPHHRLLTIEQYEIYGSWIYEREDDPAAERARELVEAEVSFERKQRRLQKKSALNRPESIEDFSLHQADSSIPPSYPHTSSSDSFNPEAFAQALHSTSVRISPRNSPSLALHKTPSTISNSSKTNYLHHTFQLSSPHRTGISPRLPIDRLKRRNDLPYTPSPPRSTGPILPNDNPKPSHLNPKAGRTGGGNPFEAAFEDYLHDLEVEKDAGMSDEEDMDLGNSAYEASPPPSLIDSPFVSRARSRRDHGSCHSFSARSYSHSEGDFASASPFFRAEGREHEYGHERDRTRAEGGLPGWSDYSDEDHDAVFDGDDSEGLESPEFGIWELATAVGGPGHVQYHDEAGLFELSPRNE